MIIMTTYKYKNNNLNEILFKIDFSPILELYGKEDSAKEFQEKVYKIFPTVDILEKRSFKISPINGRYSNQKEYLTWVFSDTGKRVELNATSLSLQYEGEYYDGYEEFKKDIKLILDSIKEYPITTVNFIGLRYINQIHFENNENFKEFINDNLHSITNEFEHDTVLQSLSKTDLKINDYVLSFQYGQFNPEYPNNISNKDFILDFNCYLNETELFDKIIDDLDEMHEVIKKHFEKSIKESLRLKMGVENE